MKAACGGVPTRCFSVLVGGLLLATVAILVFLAATARARVVAAYFGSRLDDRGVAALLALWLRCRTALSVGTRIGFLALGVLRLATVAHVAWHCHLRCRRLGEVARY